MEQNRQKAAAASSVCFNGKGAASILRRLHRNLTLFFFSVTGSILIVIIYGSFFITTEQLKSYHRSTLEDMLNRVSFQISNSVFISNTWLSLEEAGNQAVIYIELNAFPILFRGAYYTGEERVRLAEQVKDLAGKYIDLPGAGGTAITASPVFSFRDSKGCPCYGTLQYLISAKEVKTLVVIQSFPEEQAEIGKQGLLFLFIALGGLGLLFACSYWLVGRALRPIADNNRKQTEFIAAASHELRSPLAVILNNAAAVRSFSKETERFAIPIEQECGRMSHLIQDMLTLAATDAKTWALNLRELETDTFIIGIYEKYKNICRQRGHMLEIELAEDPFPPLCGDQERLEQVFSILLDNALSYTPEGTSIILRAFSEGNVVCFELEDHGPGIPPEIRERVFDRFFRGDRSRKDKEHFGLGLSIAHELVTLHGGRMSLQDTQGGGATFLLRLEGK